jgi:hypothetical protein
MTDLADPEAGLDEKTRALLRKERSRPFALSGYYRRPRIFPARRELPEPETLTLDDLIRVGGPDTYIRQAARDAARQAAKDATLEESRRWLDLLEEIRTRLPDPKDPDADSDEVEAALIVRIYLRKLRRRLGVRDLDKARAQTRERVRRLRQRQREAAGSSPSPTSKRPS